MRLIDADELKKDLTRFYDNEVTAKQLIDEQPTIEPEQRWIPCSERMPDGDGTYIVCLDNGAVFEYDYIISKWLDDDTWRYCGEDVVAWMPRPEPWKGDAK